MERDQTPRRWLMTDERLGDRLFPAIAALSPGDGVVLRHHGLDPGARRRLGEAVASAAAAGGLVLSVSRDVALAAALGARWVHNPAGDDHGLFTSRSVHDEAQARAARGAALAFVSPVFATRSHPGGRVLGAQGARALAALAGTRCIALGGMDAERFVPLATDFYGWAGIDAFARPFC